ncbi:exopolysaccharide biosynthesis protein [Marilutibacter alkalisoli]|uniref:exopolysaccharide biosynthesis protein n=1 Tax=Marilutibacter alkalisoli TaxID=2591633 RepID=UPI002447DC3E|nr:exopolysaccharide biosynthesis protein [Lysobacter alkalisoli]
MLDLLSGKAEQDSRIEVSDMLGAVGQRSFGPMLLVPGLTVLSPLSAVPGLPTAMAIIVALVATQLLLQRRCFWLPGWVLRRSIDTRILLKALRALRPVARVADRMTRPRLQILAGTDGITGYPVALLCLLIALTMPPLELIPFANSLAGAALTIFGLALITRDGLLVLLAGAVCAAIVWLVAGNLSALDLFA